MAIKSNQRFTIAEFLDEGNEGAEWELRGFIGVSFPRLDHNLVAKLRETLTEDEGEMFAGLLVQITNSRILSNPCLVRWKIVNASPRQQAVSWAITKGLIE